MLVDKYGRELRSIRLSVTSRCNLKCFYCHNEGIGESEELSPEDYGFLFKIASKLGMKKLKITGGEPLLRKDLEKIIQEGKKYFVDVSLTTNGTLLAGRVKNLKKAGLNRINISLDTLQRKKYEKITGMDMFDKVIDGIKESVNANLKPVKINVVVFKNLNDNEIPDFIKFSGEFGVIVQFIQPMGINNGYDFSALEKFLEKNSLKITYNDIHRRRQYYLSELYGNAIVEVVKPIHNTDFCMNCNRIRITPDGKLKPCLLRKDYVDARLAIEERNEKSLIDAFIRVNEIRRPFWAD